MRRRRRPFVVEGENEGDKEVVHSVVLFTYRCFHAGHDRDCSGNSFQRISNVRTHPNIDILVLLLCTAVLYEVHLVREEVPK